MKSFARVILIATALISGAALAQNYPGSRPVRILVGYTPGGGVDTAARMMAQALGELPARRWFLLAPPGQVANAHLMTYWRQRLPVRVERHALFRQPLGRPAVQRHQLHLRGEARRA